MCLRGQDQSVQSGINGITSGWLQLCYSCLSVIYLNLLGSHFIQLIKSSESLSKHSCFTSFLKKMKRTKKKKKKQNKTKQKQKQNKNQNKTKTDMSRITLQLSLCLKHSLNPRQTKGGGLQPPLRFFPGRTKTLKKVMQGIKVISFTSSAVILMKIIGGTTLPGGSLNRQSQRVRGVVANFFIVSIS